MSVTDWKLLPPPPLLLDCTSEMGGVTTVRVAKAVVLAGALVALTVLVVLL